MSRSMSKPSFNPAAHPQFAGKSPPRPTTSEHRTAAIAAPPKSSPAPSWKPPKPEHSPGVAPKRMDPEHSHHPREAEYGRSHEFEAPSKTSGPGFGGTLEAHPKGQKPRMKMQGD